MLHFAQTAEGIGATSSTLEKARLLADYLRPLTPDDLRRAAIYMSGQPYGRAERRTLNLGWATIGRVVERLSGRDTAELNALFLKHSDLGDWAFEALSGHTHPTQVSLGEVAAAHPLQHGLAELVAYLSLASDDPAAIIDDAEREAIVWTDRKGQRRQATIPLVIFARAVSVETQAGAAP